MIEITEITSDAKQKMKFIGENQEQIDFSLEYSDSQQSWFYSLTYNEKTINGRRLMNSPNILLPWRDIFPFGISCMVLDGSDPFFIDDFINGRVKLYLLTSEELDEVETELASE